MKNSETFLINKNSYLLVKTLVGPLITSDRIIECMVIINPTKDILYDFFIFLLRLDIKDMNYLLIRIAPGNLMVLP